MKRLKILGRILKETGAAHMLIVYAIVVVVIAAVIWLIEPHITRFGDALWYCYAVLSTIGFGDVLVTSPLSKILSLVVTVYSSLIIAVVTGVVVQFYNQLTQLRQKETLAAFLDKLEHLPDLSKEELAELSDSVHKFRK